MTLRFFRRKSATGEEIDVEMPQRNGDEETEPQKKTASRRRSSSTARSRKATKAKPAGSGDEKSASGTASEPRSTTSRTRRGRRGGAGRKTAAPAAKAEAAPITPIREQPATIEGIMAQQAQLMETQMETLKSVQATLAALEKRIGGISGVGEQPRVGIFVDVPNVMYAAQRMKVALDFEKVLQFLLRGRELVRASAYAPISDDPKERLETQRFVQPFVDVGYRVVTKPHKRYADGSMKANFDVELAIDVLTMSDRLDTVTLVSGDGDFRRLVELVASKGVRVEVVAFQGSMASELRAVADEAIDLDEHIKELRA